MDYPILVDGFENQDIRYIPTGWFSTARLLVNGEPPVATENGLRWVLTRDDGETVLAHFHSKSIFSNLQTLEVDGKGYRPEGLESIKWYQYLWCSFPIVLIFVGGAIGGLIGAIAMFLNIQIFYRDGIQPAIKYVLTLGISIATIVLYIVFGVIISLLF
ncbi:MAG: hypothetical protein DWQ07_12920 [Chloroflexi bacterium]|nr:MAG: hypothetical protein DWQ07_12920 [Chloroflexota bacterium]MBL1196942.1 hypothetical protein [Chloroflexota bacterium]NOH14238.1 hypothetical protein [Chloroflexota bacterium]